MGTALEMHGEIAIDTVDEFEHKIRSWLADGGSPVLDMTDVTFIDSTGLNMLVQMSVTNGEPLTLQGLRPPLVKLLQLTALDQLLNIAF